MDDFHTSDQGGRGFVKSFFFGGGGGGFATPTTPPESTLGMGAEYAPKTYAYWYFIIISQDTTKLMKFVSVSQILDYVSPPPAPVPTPRQHAPRFHLI